MPVRRYCSILVGLWNKITIKSHTILQLSSHDKQKKNKAYSKGTATYATLEQRWLATAAGITAPPVSIVNPSREGRGQRAEAARPRSHAPRTHLGHSGSRRAGPGCRGSAETERRNRPAAHGRGRSAPDEPSRHAAS